MLHGVGSPDPRHQHLDRRKDRRGHDTGSSQGLPRHLRRVGSLRPRWRRQFRRTRRLHRPLPDRPRRRRGGDGRRSARRRRHLEPSVVCLLQLHRLDRARVQQGGRHAVRHHGHVGRRLHDRAGERRPGRVRARIRARPGAAGRLRHERWRELHGLLDHHVVGQLQRRRYGGHRVPAERLYRVGEVSAGVAELRGVLRRPAIHSQTRPRGNKHQTGAGARHRPPLEAAHADAGATVCRQLCVVEWQRPQP